MSYKIKKKTLFKRKQDYLETLSRSSSFDPGIPFKAPHEPHFMHFADCEHD